MANFILKKVENTRQEQKDALEIMRAAGPLLYGAGIDDSIPRRYLKDKVYQTPLTDLEDLKNRIRNKCEALNVQLLRSVTTRELLHRAECCVEANGQHFDHFL
ncbi:hypothetical protein NQ318_012022 [Aromia moschata]|uniref:Uncharacterized protein n=1 Tax=Aromia moschata TaxID=1265417 RepID=A0AAV8YCN4_9CUCU|nr:hypothetical protein NQ318_012022 [Aromia moschata]